MTTAAEMVTALLAGERTLTEVVADFKTRDWVDSPDYSDVFTDPDVPDPNSWDAVGTDPRLDTKTYATLADAYLDSQSTPLVAKFDPNQPRDSEGKWSKIPGVSVPSPDKQRFKKLIATDADVMHGEMQAKKKWTTTQIKALRDYASDGHKKANAALRGMSAPDAKTKKLIADARAGMRPASRDVVMFRGTWPAQFGIKTSMLDPAWKDEFTSHVGEVFHDPAFASTSTSAFSAFKTGLTVEIEVPKGTPLAYIASISANPSEREVVLAPDLHYQLLSFENTVTGPVARMRVVPPPKNDDVGEIALDVPPGDPVPDEVLPDAVAAPDPTPKPVVEPASGKAGQKIAGSGGKKVTPAIIYKKHADGAVVGEAPGRRMRWDAGAKKFVVEERQSGDWQETAQLSKTAAYDEMKQPGRWFAPGTDTAPVATTPIGAPGETTKINPGDVESLLGEVTGTDQRAEFMRNALNGLNEFGPNVASTYISRDKNGKLTGAMTIVDHVTDAEEQGVSPYSTIDYIGARGDGAGRNLVARAIQHSLDTNTTITAEPTQDSVKFWERMGFHEDPLREGTELYGLTYDEAVDWPNGVKPEPVSDMVPELPAGTVTNPHFDASKTDQYYEDLIMGLIPPGAKRPSSVNSDLAEMLPIEEVDLNDLTHTQSWIRPIEPGPTRDTLSDPPVIVYRAPSGQLYLANGHHTVNLALQNGDTTARVRVYDNEHAPTGNLFSPPEGVTLYKPETVSSQTLEPTSAEAATSINGVKKIDPAQIGDVLYREPGAISAADVQNLPLTHTTKTPDILRQEGFNPKKATGHGQLLGRGTYVALDQATAQLYQDTDTTTLPVKIDPNARFLSVSSKDEYGMLRDAAKLLPGGEARWLALTKKWKEKGDPEPGASALRQIALKEGWDGLLVRAPHTVDKGIYGFAGGGNQVVVWTPNKVHLNEITPQTTADVSPTINVGALNVLSKSAAGKSWHRWRASSDPAVRAASMWQGSYDGMNAIRTAMRNVRDGKTGDAIFDDIDFDVHFLKQMYGGKNSKYTLDDVKNDILNAVNWFSQNQTQSSGKIFRGLRIKNGELPKVGDDFDGLMSAWTSDFDSARRFANHIHSLNPGYNKQDYARDKGWHPVYVQTTGVRGVEIGSLIDTPSKDDSPNYSEFVAGDQKFRITSVETFDPQNKQLPVVSYNTFNLPIIITVEPVAATDGSEEDDVILDTPTTETAELTAAAEVHTGAMIALVPSGTDAERLEVDGGEPAEQLHLTICYLGEAALIPPDVREKLIDCITKCALRLPTIIARAFAVSAFNPVTAGADGKPDPCVVLTLSGKSLEHAYNVLAEDVYATLNSLGIDYPPPYSPWIPHITLLYTDDADISYFTDRIGLVTFDTVRLAFGGEIYDIPLGESGEVTAAFDPNQPRDGEGQWTDTPGGGDHKPKFTKYVNSTYMKDDQGRWVSEHGALVMPASAEGLDALEKAGILRPDGEVVVPTPPSQAPSPVKTKAGKETPLTGVAAEKVIPRMSDADANDYVVEGFTWNALLRGQDNRSMYPEDDDIPDIERRIKQLDVKMRKMSLLTQPVGVERGVANASYIFGEMGSSVGKDFTDSGYSSTTVRPGMAKMYAEMAGGDIAVMRMIVPKGMRIAQMGPTNIGEVLLPRDLRFKITRDELVDGVRTVEVLVALPEEE